MSVCALILCLCCPVCRQRPCDGLITSPRSSTGCVKKNKELKRPGAQEGAVVPVMMMMMMMI
jgi:hypothetical protein